MKKYAVYLFDGTTQSRNKSEYKDWSNIVRLHALIFASSVGAPLAAISYDPKVTGFMAYLGQKHCMELADVTKDSLCALIDDAMQTAQPYSTDRLCRLAAENEEAARKLLEESV